MNIGEVLSRAWQIIWKHKVLWIFGILAGFTASRGENWFSYQISSGGTELPAEPFGGAEQYFSNLPPWQLGLILVGVVLLILTFTVLVIFLGSVGRIALARGTQLADTGVERLAFGELFRGALPYFWRFIGLNLLFIAAAVLLSIPLVGFVVLSATVTAGIALICLVPLLCLLFPLLWLASIFVEQANAALVIDNIGVFEAIRRGWDTVRSNPAEVILMGLILGIGGGVIGFLLAMPLLVLLIPLMISLSFWIFNAGAPSVWGMILAGVGMLFYLPFLLAFGGALRAYIGSAWALTYLRLSGRISLAVDKPA
jgi:hypothetical protein